MQTNENRQNTINRETMQIAYLYAVEHFETACEIITRADEDAELARTRDPHALVAPDRDAGHKLREHFETINPLAATDTIFSDFITAALARINWQQVVVFVRAKMAQVAEIERQAEVAATLTRLAEQEPAIADLLRDDDKPL